MSKNINDFIYYNLLKTDKLCLFKIKKGEWAEFKIHVQYSEPHLFCTARIGNDGKLYIRDGDNYNIELSVYNDDKFYYIFITNAIGTLYLNIMNTSNLNTIYIDYVTPLMSIDGLNLSTNIIIIETMEKYTKYLTSSINSNFTIETGIKISNYSTKSGNINISFRNSNGNEYHGLYLVALKKESSTPTVQNSLITEINGGISLGLGFNVDGNNQLIITGNTSISGRINILINFM